MFSLTWLPEALQEAGLKVAETPDWRTRGRAEMGTLKGVMCHHTATPKHVLGNMPTLDLLINGRAASGGTPALAGPLAQLGLGRDGTFYVIASGRANHAGSGHWQGLVDTGNSSFIGIEAENSGLPDDLPWPDIQLDAYCRGVAALLRRIGAGPSMCCGHKEYATPAGRKSDPDLDMAVFRSRVASFLGGSPARPLIAAMDAANRLTLRRGATGDAVKKAQGLLALPITGVFDAVMEAALRRFQAVRRLTADGILGPLTWNALEPTAASMADAATSPASVAPLQPPAMPLDEAPGRPPTIDGLYAIAPDGTRFARRSGPGFFTIATTTLSSWLASPEASGVNATESQKRVVRAMSVNEGGMEAVNSYDSNFISFGIFQWTAGGEDQAGELPILLSRLKERDLAAYADCFGKDGLDTVVAANAVTGNLTLNGTELRSKVDKAQLRDVSWAYRFWRAGHNPVLRTCEAELAVSRINRFHNVVVEGCEAGQWMTSELGVALLLDEHVNRPNHVLGTLGMAIRATSAQLPPNPSQWTTQDEHILTLAYIEARRPTGMTDSDKRANAIMAFVLRSALSDERNSYFGH